MRLHLILWLLPNISFAFCGFYVAKADSSLYNKASQVVVVRDGNRTALSMFNDYKGELTDFALVVPVPEVLAREQINVGDKVLFERIDAYSAPRLVEYFDQDPCQPMRYGTKNFGASSGAGGAGPEARARQHGVKIEAKYTIGEYDILLLSAKESGGLETWLKENGYKVPKGASRALEPYIKQDMKFFVAKVNLKEQAKTGFTFLRPIQFAFETPKFMLPIRLGMVNGEGSQDLIIYMITKRGRVETTNYRTVRIPTGHDVPLYIKGKFADFYQALFEEVHGRENKKVVFQEYGWNMASCDPCVADPLSNDELRKLGVFWIDEEEKNVSIQGGQRLRTQMVRPNFGMPAQAYVTRLHVRYDREHFPEDLVFQETQDTDNFQGRYVMYHPWAKEMKCQLAEGYNKMLKERHTKQAENVARLTGWKIESVYKEMGDTPQQIEVNTSKKWYQKIFK